MLLLWIGLCFTWPGMMGFTVRNVKEGLCLEDSSEGEVHLKTCKLDSDLQQWMWSDRWFLVNTGTSRCLSAIHSDPVQTVSCDSGEHIQWQCKAQQMISVRNSLALSAESRKLGLNTGQHIWTSLDADDICQDKLRSRRQSDADFESLKTEEPEHRMTEEQMKFLQWFYRTEDSTSWKFAMLVFAFLGLLIGCMLMVMGMMVNRSRKQIAKYRASTKVTAVKAKTEELRVIITEKATEEKRKEEKSFVQTSHTDWEEPSVDGKASEDMKSAEIMGTWKDGNVSALYPEPMADGEVEEEVHN